MFLWCFSFLQGGSFSFKMLVFWGKKPIFDHDVFQIGSSFLPKLGKTTKIILNHHLAKKWGVSQNRGSQNFSKKWEPLLGGLWGHQMLKNSIWLGIKHLAGAPRMPSWHPNKSPRSEKNGENPGGIPKENIAVRTILCFWGNWKDLVWGVQVDGPPQVATWSILTKTPLINITWHRTFGN